MSEITGRVEFRFKQATSSQEQALASNRLRERLQDVPVSENCLHAEFPLMPNGSRYVSFRLPDDKEQSKTLVQDVLAVLRAEGSVNQNTVVYSPLL